MAVRSSLDLDSDSASELCSTVVKEIMDSSSGDASGASLVGFQELLDSFRQRLTAELDRWLPSHPEDGQPVEGLTDLDTSLREFIFRGGKRLRPALVHHAYGACGGTDKRVVLPLAMAVELLHTYLLVHDDIMDRAETRRGAPAAHVGFRSLHESRGWRGSAQHYGESVAILIGDLAHSYALELFDSAAAAVREPEALRRCFHAMGREVIVGQYLEVTVGFRESPSAEELRRILQLKSARYSVERPIQLGALAAAAPPARLAVWSRYGLAMGEAFQLQDDLLGMFGDAEITGKPVGEDLREGKYTFLVYYAVERATAQERERIRSALGNAAVEAGEVERVREIMERTGAREMVVEMVEKRMETAIRELEKMELEEEGRRFFDGLIEYLRGRSR